MSITAFDGRVFDYVPLLSPENEKYLIRDVPRAVERAEAVNLWERSRGWLGGPVLDQQAEGACVPHGVVGEATASPVRVRPRDPQALAFQGYDWCRRNDVFPGENYSGTDTNTGMKWGRLQGWWPGWNWAKNMDELRMMLEFGPVGVGVLWKSGMYETVGPRGYVNVSGYEVGWHFLLITGYFPNYDGIRGNRRFRWRNSWGLTYGVNGNGYPTPDQVNDVLFRARGEAVSPSTRYLGHA